MHLQTTHNTTKQFNYFKSKLTLLSYSITMLTDTILEYNSSSQQYSMQ